MKKSLKLSVIGGFVAISIMGYGFATPVANAADATSHSTMMQGGQMDPKMMADMMATPEFQQRCIENMKKPEMQQMLIKLMKQPEMQAAMKQMMQRDMTFHQMMLDLANSVDMNMDHGNMTNDSTMGSMDMSGHH